ncbi:MAG: hypothetical protein QGG14_01450 [Planctomycetota bacterium]|jgi:hypothetical protein|nr:hypothetical protein [Planctomycetota bacterium]
MTKRFRTSRRRDNGRVEIHDDAGALGLIVCGQDAAPALVAALEVVFADGAAGGRFESADDIVFDAERDKMMCTAEDGVDAKALALLLNIGKRVCDVRTGEL